MKPCRSSARDMARGLLAGALVVGLTLPPTAWAPPAARAAEGDTRVGMAELTPEVEAAIDRGLKALVAQQNKDGSWGGDYKGAGTSLSLMAFMLKGHFPKKGIYGSNVERGLDYLLKKSSEGSGYIGTSMYEHALATLALSEAWGMSDRDEIRDALKRAVDVILRAQAGSGGWRYDPRPVDADISVTAMQIVALVSAREAGILVPTRTIERAANYVKNCQVAGSGGFGYQDAHSPVFSRSAAGLMGLLMTGDRNTPAVRRSLDYLKKLPESKFTRASGFYMYGHYYAVQSMYQAGESHYQEWYPSIRDALLSRQGKNGSWSAPECSEGWYGTSMAILILGVPYRYLPIYQR